MSKYMTYPGVQFKSRDLLLAALHDLGWQTSQIEVHEAPRTLYGYQGDARPEKANIIIRRQHVGGVSNDLGFALDKTGAYVPIVSEYDASLLKKLKGGASKTEFVSTLRGAYNAHVAERVATRMRGTATETRVGSTRKIVVRV